MKILQQAAWAAILTLGAAAALHGGPSAASGPGLLAQAPMVKPPLAEPRFRQLPRPGMQYQRRLRQCPDPAVTGIDFTVVSRSARFRGRVEIAAEVENVGRAAYRSRPRQQSLQLYETVPGGRSRLIARTAFVNLDPGQSVRVSYRRDWNASSPAEGEFPPTYRALVSYDPDITMDGNPDNDDCVSTNNRRERSGADINALFR